ncbi:MAG: hypothetical protein C0630_10645 [Sedimenticola selenatireducens]|uniref:Uncharacterized protein n=1 Tax=Sedimenticola selenatireducens TaxID=191960 RepID=A0A2N6CWH1_9GAMM|nr:MAG: hypothetical protein C0630_10645 [Sedimenticola selenatireducens]
MWETLPSVTRIIGISDLETIAFPNKWVSGQVFEQALRSSTALLTSPDMSVRFEIPSNCKIMVAAGVKLLSLANQLKAIGKSVSMSFGVGSAALGYLNRIGFFDLLDARITVEPERPSYSGAQLYRGGNKGLVEFAPISPIHQDRELPSRLERALTAALPDTVDRNAFGPAAYTVLGELISNIYEHSETNLDGFAVLQVYPQGKKAMVAVSDSGKGLIQTLRPALLMQDHALGSLDDASLLVEAFRNGLSRHGEGRGNGLKQCATKAIRYNANLEVRLPNTYVRLVPSTDGYTPHTVYSQNDAPLLWGTHIAFEFALA